VRGFPQRVLLCLACFVALLAACPKPGPSPIVNPPDAADAARPVTCAAGCAHAVAVCPSVDDPTCMDICRRIGSAFSAKLGSATSCADVKAAGK
jgi:hypothetical protein